MANVKRSIVLDVKDMELLTNALQSYICLPKCWQDDSDILADNLMERLCQHLDKIDAANKPKKKAK